MSKKGTKALASATLMSLVLTTALSAGPVKASSVERQGGSSRVQTAVEVAKTFGTADTVVLVNGIGYADAVAATPLAKAYNAPILLTSNSGDLESDVANAIATLGAKNVIIVGGTGAVSSTIESSLKSYKVTRLAGQTRFETSAKVAQAVIDKTGKDTAILVNGADGYADALSVASVAAAKGYPVIITNKTGVADAVKAVVTKNNLKVLAVGGDSVLPASVAAQVNATKIANGNNRFATNLAVLEYFKSDLNMANIYVAAGGADSSNQFADALVASAAAAKAGAPVVLTGLGASDAQKSAATKYVSDNKNTNTKVTIVGQTGSVDAAIENDINNAVNSGVLAVASVSATNATTLTVTGTALDKLAAADITVAGNKVSSVTPSTDGKSATVVLTTIMTANVEQKVTIKGTDYKVTYSLVANGAEIKAATYDDSRPNQKVAFTVNGAATNVDDLIANGYTVAFTATNKDENTDVTSTLFANTQTGELNTGLTAGTDYKVQVTITNATTSITSALQTISIKNLDLSASAINSYDFTNGTGVLQNSTKLVVGETGSFTQLKVVEDGTEQKETTGWTIDSSNPAVISVSGGTVTANAPGTATLKITFGSVTKDVTFTVVDAERKLNSIKVTKSATNDAVITNKSVVVGGATATVSVQPLDQYGDPMSAGTLNVYNPDSTIATVSSSSLTAAANGKVDLTITAVKAGNITLLFRNTTTNATVGSFAVATTENGGVATKKLEIAATLNTDPATKSIDNTLDLSSDYKVEYKLNEYNSENVSLGSKNLTGYTASVADSTATSPVASVVVGTKADGSSNNTFMTITGLKAGNDTITLKDNLGVVVGTVNVTVVDKAPKITGVSFKPQTSTVNFVKTIDYKTFLNYTDAGSSDAIISGITLSQSTNSTIRLTTAGELYLDKNGNASFDAGTDIDLGKIVLTATTDSTSLSVTSNAVTTGTGSKGTLVFKVIEPGTPTVPAVYGSTSLNVDVK